MLHLSNLFFSLQLTDRRAPGCEMKTRQLAAQQMGKTKDGKNPISDIPFCWKSRV
jgi:hypothetical protein